MQDTTLYRTSLMMGQCPNGWRFCVMSDGSGWIINRIFPIARGANGMWAYVRTGIQPSTTMNKALEDAYAKITGANHDAA